MVDVPKRFTDLRRRADAPKDTVRSLAALAFRSIASTPQGDAVRDYLASEIFDTTPVNEEGAWREREARRRFAEEILTMMEGKHGQEREQPERSE